MTSVTGTSRDGASAQRVQLAFRPSVFTLELMGGEDTARFRDVLVGHGLEDVTPPFNVGGELKIPTQAFLRGVNHARWSGYWHALRTDWRVQTATWVCLSGHHGRRHSSTPADRASEINAVKQTGFFNAPFHDNEWTDGKSTTDESIFVYSSSTLGPDTEAAPEWGAPFRPNRRCAGVFLSGCNTLSYPATRRWVRKTFPLAIVFGFINRTHFGAHNAAPLVGTRRTTAKKPIPRLAERERLRGLFEHEPDFWKSPVAWIVDQANASKRTLDQQIEAILLELNRIYRRASGRGSDLAMIVGDDIFLVTGGTVAKERYDFTW